MSFSIGLFVSPILSHSRTLARFPSAFRACMWSPVPSQPLHHSAGLHRRGPPIGKWPIRTGCSWPLHAGGTAVQGSPLGSAV